MTFRYSWSLFAWGREHCCPHSSVVGVANSLCISSTPQGGAGAEVHTTIHVRHPGRGKSNISTKLRFGEGKRRRSFAWVAEQVTQK